MKIVFTLALLLWALPALAQVYPQCPSGVATSCTMTVHVTGSTTPIFKALSQRQYLFLQNTGYTFSSIAIPSLNQNPIFCAIGSSNNPVTQSAPSSNVIVLQAGGTYEPLQIVKPQNAFTVPSGDVSCQAPLGDAWLTIEEE